MIMLILGVVVVIAFALGMMLIFRGFLGTPDADRVVDIEEFNKLNNTLSQTRQQEETLKLQLDGLTLDLQNSRTRVTQLEKAAEQLAQLKIQKETLDDQIGRLKQDLEFITGKADQQASEALEVLEDLKQRNANLTQSVGEFQARAAAVDPQEIESLRKEKESLQGRLDEQIKQLKNIESTLDQEKRTAESRSAESRSQLEKLTAENQNFLKGLKGILEKIKTAESALAQAKSERSSRLKSENELIGQLKSDKQKLEQELLLARSARVTQVQADVVQTPPVHQLAESGAQVEDLLNQVRTLRSKIDENARMIQFFQQKEKVMEEDLTRARAQAMGLAKICEEFKKELDKSQVTGHKSQGEHS